jgi:hypothetical protein
MLVVRPLMSVGGLRFSGADVPLSGVDFRNEVGHMRETDIDRRIPVGDGPMLVAMRSGPTRRVRDRRSGCLFESLRGGRRHRPRTDRLPARPRVPTEPSAHARERREAARPRRRRVRRARTAPPRARESRRTRWNPLCAWSSVGWKDRDEPVREGRNERRLQEAAPGRGGRPVRSTCVPG